jgi:lipooligosaccharide transport system permease protein
MNLSGSFIRVWQRNLIVYRQNWKISFLPPLLEPLLYLAAFGVGLSGLIGNLRYRGEEISYVAYLAPSLIAINIMNSAFFENTYASFVRMYYQKMFDGMMATPLTVEEIITGEIAWGATKSLIGTVIMMAVISLFGLLRYPESLLILPLSFLAGFAFGSVGMFFTGITPNIELFNLPMFLFITPMFLFGGTFFPIDALPSWAQTAALAFPLTHLVNAVRDAGLGHIGPHFWWGLAYLSIFAAFFFPVSVRRMRRRLIK